MAKSVHYDIFSFILGKVVLNVALPFKKMRSGIKLGTLINKEVNSSSCHLISYQNILTIPFSLLFSRTNDLVNYFKQIEPLKSNGWWTLMLISSHLPDIR